MEFHLLLAAALLALAAVGRGNEDPDPGYETAYDPYYGTVDNYKETGYETDIYDPTYVDTGYDTTHYDYLPPKDGYVTGGDYFTDDTYVPSHSVYPPAGGYEDYKDDYVPVYDYTTEIPYTVPDVVYPSGYGTHYGIQDEFAILWSTVWTKVHIMKAQVHAVEEYRNDIIAQITKLSQKVFGWCRSKNAFSLSSSGGKIRVSAGRQCQRVGGQGYISDPTSNNLIFSCQEMRQRAGF